MNRNTENFIHRMIAYLLDYSPPEERERLVNQFMDYLGTLNECDTEIPVLASIGTEKSMFWELRNAIQNYGYRREYEYMLANPKASQEDVDTFFADLDEFMVNIRPGKILERLDRDTTFVVLSVVDDYTGIILGKEYGDLKLYPKELIHEDPDGEKYVLYTIVGKDIYNYKITDREVEEY